MKKRIVSRPQWRARWWYIVIAGAALVPARQSAVQAQLGEIRGVVRDVASGAPLANTWVYLTTSTGFTRTTRSDQEGRFLLVDIPVGSASLGFESEDHVPYKLDGFRVLDGEATTVEMALTNTKAIGWFRFMASDGGAYEVFDDGQSIGFTMVMYNQRTGETHHYVINNHSGRPVCETRQQALTLQEICLRCDPKTGQFPRVQCGS